MPIRRPHQAAIEVLKTRDCQEFAGELVDLVHTPIRFDLLPLHGPGSRGSLTVDTPRFHIERTYDAPPAFTLGSSFFGYVGFDENGLPVVIRGAELGYLRHERSLVDREIDLGQLEARTRQLLVEAQVKASIAQERLAADLNAILLANAQARFLNSRVLPVLKATAGAPDELDEDEDGWHVWWYDKLGYRYQPSPRMTIIENAVPQFPPPEFWTCFAAGTLVDTLEGPRPIESIAIGDQVLSQDVSTGALSFEPVVVVHHNPPGQTLRIVLSDGGSVVCSVYHRFWRRKGLGHGPRPQDGRPAARTSKRRPDRRRGVRLDRAAL